MCNSAEPDGGTGQEGGQRKRNETEIGRNDRRKQNQTISCYICRHQTENFLRPLWGIQAENHQEHLQVENK